MSESNDRLREIFAAVVPGAKNPDGYDVHLVNTSEYDITDVENFYGAMLEGEQLAMATNSLGPLGRGKTLLFDELNQYDLDFACWYNLKLRFSDGLELKTFFQITKFYDLSADRLRACPVLGQDAYHFELQAR